MSFTQGTSPWHLAVGWGAAETTIPVIDPPEVETFRREYLAQSRPVVLRGLSSSWKAAHEWSIASLKRRFGNRRVPLAQATNGLLEYAEGKGMKYRDLPLAEYLDTMERDGSPPRQFLTVRPQEYFPELLEEVDTPPYCRVARYRDYRVSVGVEGVTTPVHREFTGNFFTVISGEKELAMFPPDDSKNVYAFGFLSGIPHLAAANPCEKDVARFPRIRQTRPHRCMVGPGDVLFIPRGWWHAVRTNTETIAFSGWWAEGAWSLVLRAAQGYKKVLGIRT